MTRSELLGTTLGWLLPLLLARPLVAGELRTTLQGIHSPPGTMLTGLNDSAESFTHAIESADKEGFLNHPARVVGAARRANVARGMFTNLVPGRYAVICFHDVNGNGRLDRSFWGVPKEPYAFGNDANGFLGPPSFDDAATALDGSDKAVVVLPAEAR
jgi:uncharacterized protein (DUF2141 family)